MIIFLLVAVLLVAVAAAAFSVFGFGRRPLRRAEVVIGANTFSVEVASTALARANGLSGRSGLGNGEGMYFIFDSPGNYGFWMKDMKFPIDMIWISGGRVVGLAENAAPDPGVPLWKLKIYYPPELADRVLEIKAGGVRKYGLKDGDSVQLNLL